MPKVSAAAAAGPKSKMGVSSTTSAASPGRVTKRRANKPKKDPNAPKRPLTAYFFFINENRAKVKEANPDLKLTQISTELGKRWQGMALKEKAKFEKMAEKDKVRYAKEMEGYTPPPPDSDDDG